MIKLRRILEISHLEWAYLARAILGLAGARIEFGRASSQSILGRLQANALEAPRCDVDLDLGRLSWAIAAASRVVPWRSDCLIQSMAAHRWLRNRGFIPTFKLGVVSDQSGHILGHAWIEVDGRILTGGAAVEEYRLLISS